MLKTKLVLLALGASLSFSTVLVPVANAEITRINAQEFVKKHNVNDVMNERRDKMRERKHKMREQSSSMRDMRQEMNRMDKHTKEAMNKIDKMPKKMRHDY